MSIRQVQQWVPRCRSCPSDSVIDDVSTVTEIPNSIRLFGDLFSRCLMAHLAFDSQHDKDGISLQMVMFCDV